MRYEEIKVTKYIIEILAVVFLCLAVLLMIHQQLTNTCDVWFHVEEIASHEVAASFCIVAAVALVIGKYLGKHLK
jgi:hypothetical protein